MQSSIGEVVYSIITRKLRNKITVQNLFQKSRPEIVDPQEKQEL